VSLAVPLPAAEQPSARVGVGEGVLAASTDSRTWRVLHPGDVVPPRGSIRTAAGPCAIDLPEGTLHLVADTRLRWDLAQRQAEILSGAGLLKAGPKAGWTFQALGLSVEAKAGATFEISVDGSGAATLAVLEGSATISGGAGTKPSEAGSKTLWTWRPAEKKLTHEPLSAKAEQRLQRRTKPQDHAQGLGQLVAKDAQSGQWLRFPVDRYHVHVVLHPPVALVRIDQSFFNPNPRQQEGTFPQAPRSAALPCT
jgi:ferric-dicitrate binding protein FerR (iron transport regulator)